MGGDKTLYFYNLRREDHFTEKPPQKTFSITMPGHGDPEQLPRNTADPDLGDFYKLVSKRTLNSHYISREESSPESLAAPLYCITKHELPPVKSDVEVRAGGSKTGPILGVVKMKIGRHVIGLGDPDAIFSEGEREERIVWEDMQRVREEKFAWKTYVFEFESGGGLRKKYTWRKTKMGLGVSRIGMFTKQMELRVSDPEAVNTGELVAKWQGSSKVYMKQGSLFIKRRTGRDGDGDEEMEEKRWELMVLLTLFAIIETAVRRNR